MANTSVSKAEIIRFEKGIETQISDLVAVEEPLEIRLGYGRLEERFQQNISVTMRTPGHDFELALGFLLTENIISSREQISSIHYCKDEATQTPSENIIRVELNPEINPDLDKLKRNFYTTSSCGVCGKASLESVITVCPYPIKPLSSISKELIVSLPEKVMQQQKIFGYTGGLHASALFTLDGNFILLREDVGRHNALDKLIGAMAESLPLAQNILFLSGRASFELIQKASMAGIPMVVAVGAPSSLAIQLAKETNITLIGFLRGDRFNVYSGIL